MLAAVLGDARSLFLSFSFTGRRMSKRAEGGGGEKGSTIAETASNTGRLGDYSAEIISLARLQTGGALSQSAVKAQRIAAQQRISRRHGAAADPYSGKTSAKPSQSTPAFINGTCRA